MNNKNSYQFDFNLSSQQPHRPLNQQPNRPNNPTTKWTHQPLGAPASLSSAPVSMVGDIFGKTWAPSAPSSSLGLPKTDPNLFSDLLGSALPQSRNSSLNAPLKSSAPRNSYSTGNLSDSLPKQTPAPVATNTSYNRTGSWGSGETFGNFNSSGPKMGSSNNVGGGGMAMNGGKGGYGNSSKDPFENLMGLGSQSANKGPIAGSGNSASKGGLDDFGDFRGVKSANKVPMNASGKSSSKGYSDSFGSFGDFQGVKPAAANKVPMNASGNSASMGNSGDFGSFGDFQGLKPPAANKVPMNASSKGNSDDFASFGDFQSVNESVKDDFGSFSSAPPAQKPATGNAGIDPLDMFAGIDISGGGVAGSGAETFSEMNDWDIGGGDVDGGMTTEIEGLPPPPAGVTALSAKTKGMDNYKQGQFADAIKWLSWAVVLLEKSKDRDLAREVLSCRASCYKEVGEYKKAVADCSKVLEHDSVNVAILVQRALLYESMEKYRLGADDLRTVLKIDPANRVARSTIHRLNKFAD